MTPRSSNPRRSSPASCSTSTPTIRSWESRSWTSGSGFLRQTSRKCNSTSLERSCTARTASGGLPENQRYPAQKKRRADHALKGRLAQPRVNPIANKQADSHGRHCSSAQDEGVQRELVDRGIADGASDAQGQEHGGEGGAEGLLVRAARIEVHREENRRHGAEHCADGTGEEAGKRAQ